MFLFLKFLLEEKTDDSVLFDCHKYKFEPGNPNCTKSKNKTIVGTCGSKLVKDLSNLGKESVNFFDFDGIGQLHLTNPVDSLEYILTICD